MLLLIVFDSIGRCFLFQLIILPQTFTCACVDVHVPVCTVLWHDKMFACRITQHKLTNVICEFTMSKLSATTCTCTSTNLCVGIFVSVVFIAQRLAPYSQLWQTSKRNSALIFLNDVKGTPPKGQLKASSTNVACSQAQCVGIIQLI